MYYTGMCVCNMHTSNIHIIGIGTNKIFVSQFFFSAPNDLPNLGPRLFLYYLPAIWYLVIIFCWNKPLSC